MSFIRGRGLYEGLYADADYTKDYTRTRTRIIRGRGRGLYADYAPQFLILSINSIIPFQYVVK